MGIVNIDPSVLERPVLKEGTYGPGLQFEAEVDFTGFEYPAEEKLPAYDPEGTRGPYAYFGFRVKPEDGKLYFIDEWVDCSRGSGRRIQDFLTAAGAAMQDDGHGGFNFDPEAVRGELPKPVSGLQMAAPRTSKTTGTQFNGKVMAIIG